MSRETIQPGRENPSKETLAHVAKDKGKMVIVVEELKDVVDQPRMLITRSTTKEKMQEEEVL